MSKASLLASAALASVALLGAGDARAQAAGSTGFAVNRFEPSERGSSWFTNESLDLRGNSRPALGLVLDYQFRPLAIYNADDSVRASIVGHALTTHVGAAIVFADRLRLGLSLPVILYTEGAAATLGGVTYAAPKYEQALGDVRLSADLRLFGRVDSAITAALGAQLWAPTGDPATYTGDGSARVQPRLLVAGGVSYFGYAARMGVMVRNPRGSNFGGTAVGSELTYAAAVGVRTADHKLLVGPEVFGSTVITDQTFKTKTSPVEIILGGHYASGSVRFGAGVGSGVGRGFGAPALRVLGNLEWSPEVIEDRDGDGIADKDDACPDTPGVPSADPLRNGCPPVKVIVSDRDGDGIPDSEDACPDVPGHRTADKRTNGCGDKDGDGILDPLDACPDVAGKPSDDPKENGCPDKDTDGDGIIDKEDACPNVAGIKTDDPKTNGCPDPDRDKDGIPNDQDACPDEPGKPDPDPKKNGCPKAFVSGGQIKIIDQVKFKTASAVIQPGKDSEEVLQAVLKVLNEHKEIKKIRVEGHTDNRGGKALNKKLSLARAASVVKWLVKNGIDKDRLTSEGFGPERPLEPNETEDGRRANRRVEFHIETDTSAK